MTDELEQMMGIMSSPDGLKQMLLQTSFEDEETGHEFSQADLLADVVNIMRMDTKRIAKAVDVDIRVSQMTPERAAEILQGMAQGDDALGVLEIFDEIEDQRMNILEELEDEQTVDEFMQTKRFVLNSVPDDPVEAHDEN